MLAIYYLLYCAISAALLSKVKITRRGIGPGGWLGLLLLFWVWSIIPPFLLVGIVVRCSIAAWKELFDVFQDLDDRWMSKKVIALYWKGAPKPTNKE